ncbi:MAG TPA: DUF3037 domain-containing protein [Candidatus Acidoferrales bacterium]|nr:DUF3037 domain-containing protein [Candidatus Acidoferrales bacterium]
MSESNRNSFAYRVLRYTPNLIRDEWLNVGIVLVDRRKQLARARLIEDETEFVRLRRLHPNADENMLRGLPSLFQTELASTGAGPEWINRMEQKLSNTLQFSSQKEITSRDLDSAMERLYHDCVAVPPRVGRSAEILENTRAWIRMKLTDVFRRHRILTKMEKGVRVEQFTQPGDPMRIDYGYRFNGTRGYVQAFSLARDPAQAKVLAYTAKCVRGWHANSEFTAITEVAPVHDNPRHQFIVRLFDEQKISVVPLPQVEMFAERLRVRLQ